MGEPIPKGMSKDNPIAQELMVEMAKEPTIDQFFVRNPSDISNEQWRELTVIERSKRAFFIQKGETTRKEKDITDD